MLLSVHTYPLTTVYLPETLRINLLQREFVYLGFLWPLPVSDANTRSAQSSGMLLLLLLLFFSLTCRSPLAEEPNNYFGRTAGEKTGRNDVKMLQRDSLIRDNQPAATPDFL